VSLTMSLQLSMWKPLGFFWTLAVPQTWINQWCSPLRGTFTGFHNPALTC
jgi:hypothetical protein